MNELSLLKAANPIISKSPEKSVPWLVAVDTREVKFDVYGKRQTAKIKLLPSVFSSLYNRMKIFLFAVNSKRHFSIFV